MQRATGLTACLQYQCRVHHVLAIHPHWMLGCTYNAAGVNIPCFKWSVSVSNSVQHSSSATTQSQLHYRLSTAEVCTSYLLPHVTDHHCTATATPLRIQQASCTSDSILPKQLRFQNLFALAQGKVKERMLKFRQRGCSSTNSMEGAVKDHSVSAQVISSVTASHRSSYALRLSLAQTNTRRC